MTEFEEPTVTMSFDGDKESKFRLKFDYYKSHVEKCKELPGSRFVPEKEGGPHWTVPVSLDVARAVRAAFPDCLWLSTAVKAWGKRVVSHERNLTSILSAEKHELSVIPAGGKDLYKALRLGPKGRFMSDDEIEEYLAGETDSYQVADVAFMAACANPLNASEMGTGKTLATLATFVETEIKGPHLVVAPLSSLKTVWRKEVATWLPGYSTVVVQGTAADKARGIAKARRLITSGLSDRLVVITNPATVRLRGIYEMRANVRTGKMQRVEVSTEPENPFFQEQPWGVVVLDEFHKMGMNEPSTLMSRGTRQIKAQKRIALSGTPMGGKPLKLFGVLQWLEPKEFTSKWNFAENFLQISVNNGGYREIGGVKPEREDDFHRMLSRYMVRRTKREVLPWLPEIQRIEVDVPMLSAQAKQYEKFAQDAEIRIDDQKLSAAGILAEYTRLKQFANAECTVTVTEEWDEDVQDLVPKVRPVPTKNSNKLQQLFEILEELGIDDPESTEQIVIFSQFVAMVEMIASALNEKGIPTEFIHGGVAADKRVDMQERFQKEGGLRALVMNTLAGGVSITLDRASTVVFIDETWDPDDQSQAEARCSRASRIHQVTAYYLRSEGTVEEHIRDITQSKQFVNFNILDARQNGLRA